MYKGYKLREFACISEYQPHLSRDGKTSLSTQLVLGLIGDATIVFDRKTGNPVAYQVDWNPQIKLDGLKID